MKNLSIIVILLSVVVVGLSLAYQMKPSMTPSAFVYDVCNNSRITDTSSEQTCGDLQAFYNVEFLCTDNNKLETNVCWVEEL